MAEAEIRDNTFTCDDANVTIMTLRNVERPAALHFLDQEGKVAVTIGFDPLRVELAPHLEWDGAAKLFWNTCARLIGQEPPFGPQMTAGAQAP
jgi:hypothetical protein